VAGLAPTFGRGAMTNHWVDIKNADIVLAMGGNPAEAHPCGFKWVIEAKAHNKAKLIVVDPRFTRSAAVADMYAPLRAGSDIAFLGGLINYLIANKKYQAEYVREYTDASFIVNSDFGLKDGLFTGYDLDKRKYDKASWGYEKGSDGFVKTDLTLTDPRCVFNLMKTHYNRYTPEMVERICGTPKEAFLKVCEQIATTSTPDRVMTILYALGWTHHSQGAQMIRAGAMVQLLLGNIGLAGGGMNALRGHSNIQGLTDLGLLSTLLPGYMSLPGEKETDYRAYIDKRALKPLRQGQMSYWQNYEKFHVSLMKAWYGNAATKENNWAFDYLPKVDMEHDIIRVFDNMFHGKMNGYIVQGFNPLASFPNKAKINTALAKLKFMVVIDPLATETSEFWKNYGEFNPVDSSTIQTTVYRLPCSLFAEEDGSLVSSCRVLQWHWKGSESPGEAIGDLEIIATLFQKIRALYEKEGGAFPDAIRDLTWDHRDPLIPTSEELAKEFNGRALSDVFDPKDPTKVIAKAGEQLAGFAQLRDDGSTACGVWIFSGCWTQAGNQMARRDNTDTGLGNTPNWAWAWPANRRILYNRASATPEGKSWDSKRKLTEWTGKKWTGPDVPDMRLDAAPEEHVGPFIMNPEGVGRFFAIDKMAEGPFPEHYEPFESPMDKNLFWPNNPAALNNPAARLFKGDREQLGSNKEYPYVATTYRLTEHFATWTKHQRINAVLQPEQFVEIGEKLAAQKGIVNGDRIKVRSKRGEIIAKAVVTKRLRALTIDGKEVHTVGIPNHWGFKGQTKNGYIMNVLTPVVGDANTQTPEFKAFLVDIEKA
jgi:formate dehydrogenase-N alpha subunit